MRILDFFTQKGRTRRYLRWLLRNSQQGETEITNQIQNLRESIRRAGIEQDAIISRCLFNLYKTREEFSESARTLKQQLKQV